MFKKMSSTIVLVIFALQSFGAFATPPNVSDPSASASAQVISNPSATAISSPTLISNPTAISGSQSDSSSFGFNLNSNNLTANPVANGGLGGTGGNGGTGVGGSVDSNISSNINVNPSVSGSNDQHQHQNQNSTANNAGNSQSTTYVSNQARQHANVPNLASMFGTPTAPCALPIGGTGVGMGFGFGINTAYIAEECVKSETTKLAYQLGKIQTAEEIFCGMEHAKGTLECEELILQVSERRKQIAAIRNAKHVVVQTETGSGVEVVQVKTDAVQTASKGKGNMFGMVFDEEAKQWVFAGK